MTESKPNKPWGKSVSIDLSECAHDRLINGDLLKEFIAEVIKIVGMEAHGPCYVDRFGEGEIEGYSAMQFIKTSSITVHLDDRHEIPDTLTSIQHGAVAFAHAQFQHQSSLYNVVVYIY